MLITENTFLGENGDAFCAQKKIIKQVHVNLRKSATNILQHHIKIFIVDSMIFTQDPTDRAGGQQKNDRNK